MQRSKHLCRFGACRTPRTGHPRGRVPLICTVWSPIEWLFIDNSCWAHVFDASKTPAAKSAHAPLLWSESCFHRSRKIRKMLWVMLPRFPAGTGTRETGSKRKGKRGKEEFLKGKWNQGWVRHSWWNTQSHRRWNCVARALSNCATHSSVGVLPMRHSNLNCRVIRTTRWQRVRSLGASAVQWWGKTHKFNGRHTSDCAVQQAKHTSSDRQTSSEPHELCHLSVTNMSWIQQWNSTNHGRGCARPVLRFTWDNVLCVKVILLQVAQCTWKKHNPPTSEKSPENHWGHD